MSTKPADRPVLAAWSETLQLVRTHPSLFTPLGIAAAAKLAMVGTALVAPFAPFSKLLAPMVRYFWGDIYLHYPYHLALPTRWFRRSDLLFPVLLEAFLVGMTAFLCRQILTGHPAKFRQAFSETFRRYPATVIITVITSVVMLVCARLFMIPIQYAARAIPGLASNGFAIAFAIAFVTVVVASALEAFFTFAIPLCVLNQIAWFRALWRSLALAWRAYGLIVITVFIVSLSYLPFILLRQGSVRMVTSGWPEGILLVYLGRVMMSWGISVLLAVWSTTYLFRTNQVKR